MVLDENSINFIGQFEIFIVEKFPYEEYTVVLRMPSTSLSSDISEEEALKNKKYILEKQNLYLEIKKMAYQKNVCKSNY